MAECMTDSHTSSMFGITKIFWRREGWRDRLEDQEMTRGPLPRLSDASYLELLVQLSLYPVGDVSQGDFSLPQLWPRLQFQARRRPEAVPATSRLSQVREHAL